MAAQRITDEQLAKLLKQAELKGGEAVLNRIENGEVLDDVRDELEEQDPLSGIAYSDLADLDEKTLNENWDRLAPILEAGPQGSASISEDPTPATEEPISWATLREMPVEEHLRRKPEIDRFLESGGPR